MEYHGRPACLCRAGIHLRRRARCRLDTGGRRRAALPPRVRLACARAYSRDGGVDGAVAGSSTATAASPGAPPRGRGVVAVAGRERPRHEIRHLAGGVVRFGSRGGRARPLPAGRRGGRPGRRGQDLPGHPPARAPDRGRPPPRRTRGDRRCRIGARCGCCRFPTVLPSLAVRHVGGSAPPVRGWAPRRDAGEHRPRDNKPCGGCAYHVWAAASVRTDDRPGDARDRAGSARGRASTLQRRRWPFCSASCFASSGSPRRGRRPIRTRASSATPLRRWLWLWCSEPSCRPRCHVADSARSTGGGAARHRGDAVPRRGCALDERAIPQRE